MSKTWDDTSEGISTGMKVGGAIGSVIPIPGVGTGVGMAVGGLIGGAAGYLGSESAEEKALNKAYTRMAKAPVSAYQSTSMMSTGQQKAAAEGAKQMGEVARGSATAGGSSAGTSYQRAQDISRNMMLGKAAAQGTTTEAILKQEQAVRAAGLAGLEGKVKRDHEYDLAKMQAKINQRDAEGGSAYMSPMDSIGKQLGIDDSTKVTAAAAETTGTG